MNECPHQWCFTDAGGGSGGRIAVFINEKYNFQGSLVAVGGGGADPGAAGTVFIESTVGVSKHRQLHVDGANFGNEITCTHPAVVTADYSFSEMHLKRRGCLFVAQVCCVRVCVRLCVFICEHAMF